MMRYGLFVVTLVLSLLASTNVSAQSLNPFSNEPEFLPVDQAFDAEVRQRDQKLVVSFSIQPDYYLYQHQFKVVPEQALAEPLSLPEAESHYDEYFGETKIYRQYVEFAVSLKPDFNASTVELVYQGCADAGLCYPPTRLTLANADSKATEQATTTTVTDAGSDTTKTPNNTMMGIGEQSLMVSLAVFFVLGIGLAFTPCVFPMYPILSAVVIGDKPKTLKNTLWLSFIYVQGMAITYSLLGLVVALAGLQYQAYFQHPAVLIVLSIAFGLFALSMLGVFNLQLPSSWQSKLQSLSGQQRGGSTLGVFIIGAISGLVASPCTTAPLSGALLYIAQSGDIGLGAAVLYALSLGMGVPLIAFAVSGGKLLPKAGAWMNLVKHGFGWLLLAVVVFLIERLLSTEQAFWLWLTYFIALTTFMGQHLISLQHRWSRALLFLVLVSGSVLGIHWQTNKLELAEASHQLFTPVANLAEIEQQIAQAQQQQQWVMIDLYADWCVACKEFEQYTFSDAQVQSVLSDMRLLQADVTTNNATNQAILDRYQVLGLPTVLFIAPTGNELSEWRVTGFKDAEDFAQHIGQMRAMN